MTSMDSGIDTSNNSDDCSINQPLPECLPIEYPHSQPTSSSQDRTFTSRSVISKLSNNKLKVEAIHRTRKTMIGRVRISNKKIYPIFGYPKAHMMRFAAVTNNTQLMARQLNDAVSPNNFGMRGRTPLHLAASRGYTDMVSLLLAHGADPNLRDSMGNTPLHLAAAANMMSVVTLLIRAGADVSCLDHEGTSSLKLAQIILALLQDGAGAGISEVKEQVRSIIKMLVDTDLDNCLQKQKNPEADKNIETLANFYSRLSLSNTPNQIQADVKDLLISSLSSLSMNSQSADC